MLQSLAALTAGAPTPTRWGLAPRPGPRGGER